MLTISFSRHVFSSNFFLGLFFEVDTHIQILITELIVFTHTIIEVNLKSMSQVVTMKHGSIGYSKDELTSRLFYVAKLLTKPEFYNTLTEPMGDVDEQDSILGTVCYGCLLLSELIKRRPKIARTLRKVINRLLLLAIRILDPLLQSNKFTAMLNYRLKRMQRITKEAEEESSLSATEIQLSQVLKSISSYISDIRIFGRMWALPGSIASTIIGLESTYRETNTSTLFKLIEAFGVVIGNGNQPLENIAFACGHRWSLYEDKMAGAISSHCYSRSSRCWCASIIVTLIKIVRQMISYRKNGNYAFGNKTLNENLLRNILNLPLSYHWSFPEGRLSQLTVAILALAASLIKTRRILHDVGYKIQQIKA